MVGHDEDTLVCTGFDIANGTLKVRRDASLVETSHLGFDFEGGVSEALPLLYENSMVGYVWDKLFYRRVIERNKIRFDTRLAFCEDEEFTLRYMALCKRLVSVSESGYVYHVPQWDTKYVKNLWNGYHLYKCEYVSVRKMLPPDDGLCVWMLSEVMVRLKRITRTTNPMVAIRTVRELRRSLGKAEILSARVFPPVKYVLAYDKFGILSYPLLLLYSLYSK